MIATAEDHGAVTHRARTQEPELTADGSAVAVPSCEGPEPRRASRLPNCRCGRTDSPGSSARRCVLFLELARAAPSHSQPAGALAPSAASRMRPRAYRLRRGPAGPDMRS